MYRKLQVNRAGDPSAFVASTVHFSSADDHRATVT
jgi:hypothetical protein